MLLLGDFKYAYSIIRNELYAYADSRPHDQATAKWFNNGNGQRVEPSGG